MEWREGGVDRKKKVVTEFDEVEEERNVVWILDLACRNESTFLADDGNLSLEH